MKPSVQHQSIIDTILTITNLKKKSERIEAANQAINELSKLITTQPTILTYEMKSHSKIKLMEVKKLDTDIIRVRLTWKNTGKQTINTLTNRISINAFWQTHRYFIAKKVA